MVNVAPPHRPWTREGLVPQMQTDSTGVAKLRDVNPNSNQEDTQRHQRAEGAQPVQQPPQQIPSQQPAQGNEPIPEWLSSIQQRYASDYPMRLAIDSSSPIVTPDMLVLDDTKLMKLTNVEREGLARVILALAAKYMANQNGDAVIIGSSVRHYLPPEVLAYYHHVLGR